MPRNTVAAVAARKVYAAQRALSDPTAVERSVRITAAALAAGIITPETIERAASVRGSADYHLRRLAESRAELTPDQLDRLAAILAPAVGTPARGVTVRSSRGVGSPR